MTDLNVALILRLIDDFSAPSEKIRAAMKSMTTGARDFGRGMSDAIKTGFSAENMKAAIERSERDIQQARGRLMGAFGMAMTLGAPVMVAGNAQAAMTDYAKLAGLSADQTAALSAEIDKLSRRERTGMANMDLLTGLKTYVGKGLDQDRALRALEPTGRAAKATGAAFDEMAASGFAAMDNLKVAPEELRKVFDVMAQSGKEGSFELKAMARAFPELTSGAQALGMEGVDGVASLSAALQVAMKSAGSEDQAANNLSNFLGKLTAPDTVKKFKDAGINLKEEFQKAAASGADPLEHMLGVIAQATGGDQFKMGELFADKQVLDFLRAAIPNLEEYRRIKDSAMSADGIIDADYARTMGDFNEAVKQVKNSLQGLFGAAGPLLPIFTDMLNSAADWIDMARDWTAANLELTAVLVKGAAAMLAFGIGGRLLGYGLAVGRNSILRTLGLFLKFDEAGRNISLAGRALRFLGSGIGLLKGAGKLSLAALVTPLKWGAKLVPRIAWRTLAGVIRWATLIPKISWVTVAGALKWSSLIPAALKWTSRLIPGIGWAVLAGSLAWEFLIKPLGWDRWIKDIDWKGLLAPFSWDNIVTVSLDIANYIRAFSWADVLPDWDWSAIVPDFGSWFSAQPVSYGPFDVRSGSAGSFLPPVPSPDLTALQSYLRQVEVAPASSTAAAAMKVEETVNHAYKADNNVTVTVPVQITQQIQQTAVTVARDAGAKTEAAIRRSLADIYPE